MKNEMNNETKNEKKNYTVWDSYDRDDRFTGTLEECDAWIAKIEELYGKRAASRFFVEM